MSIDLTGNPARVLAAIAKARGEPLDHDMVERMAAYCDELVPVPVPAPAASEFEHLKARAAELEAWKEEGERIFSRGGFAVAFALGQWWADRPWRVRS